jgi:uncharacterized RDD family membrane protein YckC
MGAIMSTASTWRRLMAFWIDSFIAGICLLPVWLQLWGSTLIDENISVEWRWLAAGILLQLFYKWLFLYFLGGTLGKLLMGLRVVPNEHPENPLGLFQSLLRVLSDALAFFFGLAPRALALIRLDRTHVSDWVAETRVVQLVPQTQLIRRHWLLALVVMVLSFGNQFSQLYHTLRNVHFAQGLFFVEEDMY